MIVHLVGVPADEICEERARIGQVSVALVVAIHETGHLSASEVILTVASQAAVSTLERNLLFVLALAVMRLEALLESVSQLHDLTLLDVLFDALVQRVRCLLLLGAHYPLHHIGVHLANIEIRASLLSLERLRLVAIGTC